MTATAEATQLIRSLPVLERLIRDHIDAGDRAAAEAAEPHYREAAPLLLEAKESHFVGDTAGFYDWAEKKFRKKRTQISTYVSYAGVGGHKSFKTIHETKYTPKSQGGLGHNRPVSRSWTQPVDEVVERARRESMRLIQEEQLSRFEEREAERKLANRLVDIGYKVLAKELHPDKMRGDKTAFQRLNVVRDKLKHSI